MDAVTSSPAAPLPAPIPVGPTPAARPCAWPRRVQSSLVVLVGSLLVGLVVHSALQGNMQRPAPWTGEPPLTRLDLNRASRAELQLLPGVGEKLAERIDAYRILNGPYANLDELRKVPGIGPVTLERIRPWLFVSSTGLAPTQPATAASLAKKLSPPLSKKEADLTEPIDVNFASADELRKLPGIGPKLSQRIVDTRAQAPFKSVEELRRVPGIGPKTIAKLRPFVIAGDGTAPPTH